MRVQSSFSLNFIFILFNNNNDCNKILLKIISKCTYIYNWNEIPLYTYIWYKNKKRVNSRVRGGDTRSYIFILILYIYIVQKYKISKKYFNYDIIYNFYLSK